MERPEPCACALATPTDSSIGSIPVTLAPSRVMGSDRIPPPQPISITLSPSSGRNAVPCPGRHRLTSSTIKASRAGLIACSARNVPRSSHHSLAMRSKRRNSSSSKDGLRRVSASISIDGLPAFPVTPRPARSGFLTPLLPRIATTNAPRHEVWRNVRRRYRTYP